MATHYGKCGYGGCFDHGTRFISRGFNQNDYCVNGTRVSVNDDGTVRSGTPDEVRAVILYELDKYAEYIAWNREFRAKNGDHDYTQLQPFSFSDLAANLNAVTEAK